MSDSDSSLIAQVPFPPSDLTLSHSGSRADSNAVKVVARFRPFSSGELETGPATPVFDFPSENSVMASEGADSGEYVFDYVFGSDSQQEKVYEAVGRPVVEDVLIGFNGTIFAYGQTGSGKTFTMMGPDIADAAQKGIIPRAAAHIFSAAEELTGDIEWSVKCSILEIYNEKVQDLLDSENTNLQIKENCISGIYVENLTAMVSASQYVVSDLELLQLLEEGMRNRTVAMTKMNQASSRSHELVILEVAQKQANGIEKSGKLNLVDLAGSEKATAHTKSSGDTFEEMKKINLSLSALGNVIKALIAKATHIPYRDSKLTRLLQESLGGNYKTALVITCSPHKRNLAETVSTLRFGQRAKSIKNTAHVNIKESADSLRAVVQQLREELAACKSELHALKGLDPNVEKSPVRLQSSKRSQSIALDTVIETNEELIISNADLKDRIAELEEKLRSSRKKQLDTDEKLLHITDEHYMAIASSMDLQRNNENLTLQVEMLKQEIEALKAQIEFMETKQRRQIDTMASSFAKSEPVGGEQVAADPRKAAVESSSFAALPSDSTLADIRVKLSQADLALLALQSEMSSLKWRLRVTELSDAHKDTVIASLRTQIANQMDTFKRVHGAFSRFIRERPDDSANAESAKPQFMRKVGRNTLRVINSRIYRCPPPADEPMPESVESSTPATAAFEGKFQLQEMNNQQLQLTLSELTEELTMKTTLIAELEMKQFGSLQEMTAKWTQIVNEMQTQHEKEMRAKEVMISQLIDQVASWADRYQDAINYGYPGTGTMGMALTEPCESEKGTRFMRKPVLHKSILLTGTESEEKLSVISLKEN